MTTDPTLSKAEEAVYRHLVTGEYERLEALFDPELRYVHSDGVSENRTEFLERLHNGRYVYEAITSENVVTTAIGDAGALQTGITRMSVSTGGGPMTHIALRSALVWVRKAGIWQLLLRQATRIPEPRQ